MDGWMMPRIFKSDFFGDKNHQYQQFELKGWFFHSLSKEKKKMEKK
jgi:hypothetical protein